MYTSLCAMKWITRWHSFCTPDGGHLVFTAFVDGAGGIMKLTDGTVRHCWGARRDGGDTIDEKDDVNRVARVGRGAPPEQKVLVNSRFYFLYRSLR